MLFLEIYDERRSQQQHADDTKPDQAVDEVWIRAEKNASDQRRKFRLTPAIGDVGESKGAGNDADQQRAHRGRSRTRIQAIAAPTV